MKKYQVIIFIFILFSLVSCKSTGSNLNINNGEVVANEDYPTVVFFSHKKLNDPNNGEYGCSGVIVSPNVVLTVSHCFASKMKNPETNEYMVDDLKKSGIKENGYSDSNLIIGASFIAYDHLVDDSMETRMEVDENGLNENMPSKDLGAVIFDNIEGKSPFESIIQKAREKGVFFQLSSKSFRSNYIINDKNKLFFLGWGKDDKNGIKLGVKKQIAKEISCRYISNQNFWQCFPTTENKQDVNWGDSGGPLVYNNQILGFCSEYNRNGNISMFASITLGSRLKIEKRFIQKVRDELESKNLLEANSIFEELLK